MSQLASPRTPAAKQNETRLGCPFCMKTQPSLPERHQSPRAITCLRGTQAPGQQTFGDLLHLVDLGHLRGNKRAKERSVMHWAITGLCHRCAVCPIPATPSTKKSTATEKAVTVVILPFPIRLVPLAGGVLNPSTAPLPDLCAAHHSDWLTSRLRFTVPASAP